MAKHLRRTVAATVDEATVSSEIGDGEGVEATCEKCGHVEAALGTTDASRRCALAKLRENCPCGEYNFYVER